MKHRVEIRTWNFPLNAIQFADESREERFWYYNVQVRFFDTQNRVLIQEEVR